MAASFTYTGANRLADYFLRSEGNDPFPTEWWLALGWQADDTGISEVSQPGYARVSIPRTLAAWAGTQGAGTTLASVGASHTTSNNVPLDFGAAQSEWGPVTHVGLMDAETDGECWLWVTLAQPVEVSAGDEVRFQAGAIQVTLGATGGVSNWMTNRIVDAMFRGAPWSSPAEWHVAYATSAPSNAVPGNEPAAGGYARVVYPVGFSTVSSTVDFADTGASDEGRTGTVSNIVPVTFPVPTANQGTATHAQVFAPTGELMFWRELDQPKTMSAGGLAPRFDPGELRVRIGPVYVEVPV